MLVSKRFLSALCLGIIMTVVLATSVPAFGQGASDLKPQYLIRFHGSTGRHNYDLWIPGRGTTVSCANVFSVDSEHGESLEVVAFHTLVRGVRYQVIVIPNYTGPQSLKEDGILVAQGTIAEPGFYTLDIDSPVLLNPGTRYAVVLHQTASSRPALATDSARSEAGVHTVSQQGQSFVLRNGVWTDLHTWRPNTVACLQAWTLDRGLPKMSVSDMEKDLEFVLAKLRSDHPTVREKGFTLSQLDVISSVRQNICVPLSKRDFWFQLQRVFAMMNESHTTLSWMQWDDELYLNLPFRWLMDDGMVIVKDSGGFRKGDQIVSIGGRSPAEILDALWEVRASENEYWIRHSASYTLTYRSYLSYLGVVNPDNTVNIEVLRDGELLVRRLPFGRIYYGVLPSVGPIQWHIEEDNNLGYFRFDFWPSEADMGPLADALADFFSAVKSKGIDNVVFDWRNTEANYSSAERTLLSYLDTGRVYSSGYDYISHEKKPEEMLFRGKVYVLTSPGTDGSALRFVTTLHDNGVAVTVGEPTGQAASFAGPKLDNDPLPVTGWTYRIATKTYMRPRGIPNEVALFPDVPVYTTREDIIAGRDAQMEKLREIISGVPEVTVTPVTTPEIQDWTNGELPPYIREFWYVERFHYFIVIFNQPILELDPSGIRVTDASGRDLELRSVPNLTPIALDTVTISPREWVDEDDTCIITLPAGAVLLQDGSTNPATLRLGKYDYQHYP